MGITRIAVSPAGTRSAAIAGGAKNSSGTESINFCLIPLSPRFLLRKQNWFQSYVFYTLKDLPSEYPRSVLLKTAIIGMFLDLKFTEKPVFKLLHSGESETIIARSMRSKTFLFFGYAFHQDFLHRQHLPCLQTGQDL